MKAYVHFDGSPEFTVVFREAGNLTVQELLAWFASKYETRHGFKLAIGKLLASCGESRRQLDNKDIVRKVVRSCSDVYVKLCDTGSAGENTPASGPSEWEQPSPDFLVIHRLLQTAKQAEESKNFRQASRIYEKILSAIPVQTEAARQCLDSLTRLWLSVGRPVQALRWCRTLIQEFLQNAAALELLGDCLSHPVATQSELKEALLAYRRASGLATNQADVTRLLLAQARVLHRLDNSSTKAEASAIIMEVISKDSQNWEALYQYARVAKDREMTSDAIRVLLRLLVERPSHPGVRCMLAEAVAPPGNISLLIKELHGDAHTDAALAFLATCLKDYGAVDAAATLFEEASSLNFSPSYVLNLIHTYELKQQYKLCMDVALKFCKVCQVSMGAYDIPLAIVGDTLQRLGDCQDGTVWFQKGEDHASVECRDIRTQEGDACDIAKVLYSSEQLDTLAVAMTVVKILFVGGALAAAVRIIPLLEDLIRASLKPLHTTLIRNEAAYFGCIQQILHGPGRPMLLQYCCARPLFLAGDSHCLSGAWQQVSLRKETRLLVPKLVTGCKIWHVRPESVFYPKIAFENTFNSLPDHSQIIMLFGEIDCREGLLLAVEKCKYDTIEEGISVTVDIYMCVLKRLLLKGFELFIHPVPPVLNETRHIVLPFNAMLKDRVCSLAADHSGSLHWLDFLDSLLTDDKKHLEPSLEFDGTHLSPSYVKHLRMELERIS